MDSFQKQLVWFKVQGNSKSVVQHTKDRLRHKWAIFCVNMQPEGCARRKVPVHGYQQKKSTKHVAAGGRLFL